MVGDDVIKFDRCGPEAGGDVSGDVMVTAFLNDELTPGTRVLVYDEGEKFKVGTSVYWKCIALV